MGSHQFPIAISQVVRNVPLPSKLLPDCHHLPAALPELQCQLVMVAFHGDGARAAAVHQVVGGYSRKLLAFPGSLLLGRLDVRPVPPLRWIAGKEGCVLLFGGILLQRTAFHHGVRGVIKLQMEVIDSVDP